AHHMDLVETLADYVLLMHKGRSILRGTMADIRAASGMGQRVDVTLAGAVDAGVLGGLPGVERVVSTTAATARRARAQGATVGRVLHALTSQAEVVDVATDTPTLREIYLAAVSDRGLEPVDLDDGSTEAAVDT